MRQRQNSKDDSDAYEVVTRLGELAPRPITAKDVTDIPIPRSSVHRAMGAIARAAAKKQVAITEIATQKAAPPRARGSMRNKKSASSKNARRRAEGSHQKLAEEFLARLDRTWRRHVREILDRVMAERHELYFQALVRLTQVLHRRLPEPPGFDRRHYRADVMRRLELRTGARVGTIN